MVRTRQAPPYECCIAAICVVVLALTPWLPLAPLHGVAALWVRWFAGAFFGDAFTFASAVDDPPIAVFLPLVGAAALARPLLALAGRKRGTARCAAWGLGVLLLLLAGLEIADAGWILGISLGAVRIGFSCAIGGCLAVVGIGLRSATLTDRILRALRVALILSGVCLASFVLWPLGWLGWIVACSLLVVLWLRTDPAAVR